MQQCRRPFCNEDNHTAVIDTTSTTTTTTTERTLSKLDKKSSAYDVNFEDILAEHRIKTTARAEGIDERAIEEPENMEEIRQHLRKRRPSLELADMHFPGFKKGSNTNSSEAKALHHLITFLTGTHYDFNYELGTPFTNMRSMTNGKTTLPAPDLWDGVMTGTLDEIVRGTLEQGIVPTKRGLDTPILPNFFLEVKRSEAASVVAKRQALLDGAYGARAMHLLHNFGLREPVYDRKACAFSATYQHGVLQLFAHYIAPHPSSGLPEYWMMGISIYQLQFGRAQWLEAVAAFRNLRDMARDYRVRAVEAANARSQDPPSIWRGHLGGMIREQCENLEARSVSRSEAGDLYQEEGSGYEEESHTDESYWDDMS